MSDGTLDLFADDADAPAIPPRSTLYHCAMIDEGTPQQESLLNYVHRLAREHHVRVMDLLVHLILPKTKVTVAYGRFKFSSEYARTVNGYGKYASELATALEGLTARPNLRSATFLNWSALFDGKGAGLLHPTRTWCPDCLAEAEERREPHNFPLLWSCASVTHCRTHLCELQTKCFKCGAKQKPICDSAHYGRCVSCGASLAWKSALFQPCRLAPEQEFIVRGVGEMIALGSAAADVAHSSNLGRGIRRVAESTHNGSVFVLAKTIGLTPSSVLAWTDGSQQPQFDSFMKLCFRLGTSPLDLLGEVPHQACLQPGAQPLKRPSFKLSARKLRDVALEIRRNLNSDEAPIKLVELAAKYGTSVGHLRYKLPDACAALTDRYQIIRSMISEAKRDDRIRRAQKIARTLFEQGINVPRRRIDEALAADGLSLRSPITRAAAFDEIRRLTEAAVQGHGTSTLSNRSADSET